MGLERVGVVIVTYSSAGTVGATLDSVPPGVGAVVVVDNDSPDDTLDVVRAHAPAGLVTVTQPNVGFGAGCNSGERALPTEPDLVLFLNPDATIEAADLGHLVDYLDHHPGVAMVAPRIRAHGEPTYSAGRQATFWTELNPMLPSAVGRLLPYKRFAPDYAVTGSVGYVEGACMLLRRNEFRAVGSFDENYFLFFEELDVAVRLRHAGHDVHLVADAWADHELGASRETTSFGARPRLAPSAARFLAKTQGRWASHLYKVCVRASWAARARVGKLPEAEHRALVAALRSA